MLIGPKILPTVWVFTRKEKDELIDINISSVNKYLPTEYLVNDKYAYDKVVEQLTKGLNYITDDNGKPKVKEIIFKENISPTSTLPDVETELSGKWNVFIKKEMQEQYFKEIIGTVSSDRKNGNVFPDSKSLFNAFIYTPFDKVKVVIIGQDPYPVAGHANGLAFSSEHHSTPASLRVIFNEILEDFYKGNKQMASFKTNNLIEWAAQGVFLFNIALTVKENEPGSHGKIWAPFAKAVITKLSNENKGLVFMLWGKAAQSYESCIDFNNGHLVLKTNHPAAEIHSKGEIKFTGCKHFSIANEFLSNNNKSPIIWGTYNHLKQPKNE